MRFLLYPLLPIIAIAEVAALAIEIPLGGSGVISDSIDKFGAKVVNKLEGKNVIDIGTTYETKGEGE